MHKATLCWSITLAMQKCNNLLDRMPVARVATTRPNALKHTHIHTQACEPTKKANEVAVVVVALD